MKKMRFFSVVGLCVMCLVVSMLLAGCGGDELVSESQVEIDQYGFPVSVDGTVGKMVERDGKRLMVVEATAYTARPEETKSYAVGIAAWGDKLTLGMRVIAVSRDLIPLGLGHNAEAVIHGLPGTYRVLDKMNKRWVHKIDIFFGEDVGLARKWGKRKVLISWGVLKK